MLNAHRGEGVRPVFGSSKSQSNHPTGCYRSIKGQTIARAENSPGLSRSQISGELDSRLAQSKRGKHNRRNPKDQVFMTKLVITFSSIALLFTFSSCVHNHADGNCCGKGGSCCKSSTCAKCGKSGCTSCKL